MQVYAILSNSRNLQEFYQPQCEVQNTGSKSLPRLPNRQAWQ
jgi:hypothetical protein